MVENGLIMTSKDCITWKTQESGVKETLTDIGWNNNQFIAVGLNGVVLTSNDGIGWVRQTFPEHLHMIY